MLVGIENVIGSDFNDLLTGDDGDNHLQGGAEIDTLVGGAGADILDGGSGSDRASYFTSPDGVMINLLLQTADGGDATGDTLISIEFLTGSLFDDILIGDDSTNIFVAIDGDDTLNGGGGDDVLIGGAGGDMLHGGAGMDTASYGGSPQGVLVDLTGLAQFGDAEGDTLTDIENLSGSDFNDDLRGDSAANRIEGGAGNDSLLGGAGNDTLNGGSGDDSLVGANGVDLLIGGTGQDEFFFGLVSQTGVGPGARDLILDFNQAELDFIDVSVIDADIVTALDQAFLFLVNGAFTGGADGEIRFEFDGGNTIVQGELGGDGDAVVDFEIQLSGNITLVAGDFVL